MFDYVIICTAAFFAGILNTLAGGGTFLTFPALSYIGIAPVMANATSAVAVFPGYLGGVLGFRKELQSFERSASLRITFITIVGGLIGSALLLVSSDKVFSYLVPFLLLIATAVFAFALGVRLAARVGSPLLAAVYRRHVHQGNAQRAEPAHRLGQAPAHHFHRADAKAS